MYQKGAYIYQKRAYIYHYSIRFINVHLNLTLNLIDLDNFLAEMIFRIFAHVM